MECFIVGTGRCGSTLLSRMLSESPEVCSISEFFNGLDMTRRFEAAPVSGGDFADLISREHPFVTMVLRRGYDVPEIVYPFGPGARHRRDDRLPYLLVAALPRMTADPDALFDATLAFVSSLPRQPLADHYRALFDWWTRRLRRDVWIERSGSSIDYLGSLRQMFPNARFLHLHRDGRESALSMREHHAYRLAVSLMVRLPEDAGSSIDSLLTLDPAAEPRSDDPISRLLASWPPAEAFGRYWSEQLERGLGARAALGPDRYREIRFEDLVLRPAEVLLTVSDFFGLDPDRGDWVARAAALVRGAPPARFEKLSVEEQTALAAACAAGDALVGRA